MNERPTPIDADIASRARTVIKPGAYALLPRGNRVLSTLPDYQNASAQVMAAPQLGARFVEHEVLINPGGGTRKPINDDLEHFYYVLEGDVEFALDGAGRPLVKGGYVWLPPRLPHEVRNPATHTARVLWLRRRYSRVEGMPVPDPIIAHEKDVPALPEDTYLEQHLIPYENPAFDMAVNLLNFTPGVCFGYVESHIMEHGLYMLAGRGIYWLNGDYHEVQANDFIYMAPFCPQYFYATGWEQARYLIYKDVNRDYTEGL